MWQVFKKLFWPSSDLANRHHEEALEKQELGLAMAQKVFKQSRRSQLLLEDNALQLTKIEDKIDLFQERVLGTNKNEDDTISFTTAEITSSLEMFHKLLSVVEGDEVGVDIIERQIDFLSSKSNLTPIAIIGKQYDPLATIIIDSIYSTEFATGTILEVISQGYRHDENGIIQKAKIIVCSQIKKEQLSEEASYNQNLEYTKGDFNES